MYNGHLLNDKRRDGMWKVCSFCIESLCFEVKPIKMMVFFFGKNPKATDMVPINYVHEAVSNCLFS